MKPKSRDITRLPRVIYIYREACYYEHAWYMKLIFKNAKRKGGTRKACLIFHFGEKWFAINIGIGRGIGIRKGGGMLDYSV